MSYELGVTTRTTAGQQQRAAELEALEWKREGVEPMPRYGVIKMVSPSGRLRKWLYHDHDDAIYSEENAQ